MSRGTRIFSLLALLVLVLFAFVPVASAFDGRNGDRVVIAKDETTRMSNPAYGYTNIIEHWAVRISDNGEFIHQNQGTVDDQGNTNVSHGCINLSAENAEEYFNSAIYGDPVEVTGTSVPLSSDDGDLYDWTVPWDQWLTMSSGAANH